MILIVGSTLRSSAYVCAQKSLNESGLLLA